MHSCFILFFSPRVNRLFLGLLHEFPSFSIDLGFSSSISILLYRFRSCFIDFGFTSLIAMIVIAFCMNLPQFIPCTFHTLSLDQVQVGCRSLDHRLSHGACRRKNTQRSILCEFSHCGWRNRINAETDIKIECHGASLRRCHHLGCWSDGGAMAEKQAHPAGRWLPDCGRPLSRGDHGDVV